MTTTMKTNALAISILAIAPITQFAQYVRKDTKYMSTLAPMPSVCGATTAMVDIYDFDLNSHGVICCDNCQSIVLCRKAWDFLYKEVK